MLVKQCEQRSYPVEPRSLRHLVGVPVPGDVLVLGEFRQVDVSQEYSVVVGLLGASLEVSVSDCGFSTSGD